MSKFDGGVNDVLDIIEDVIEAWSAKIDSGNGSLVAAVEELSELLARLMDACDDSSTILCVYAGDPLKFKLEIESARATLRRTQQLRTKALKTYTKVLVKVIKGV